MATRRNTETTIRAQKNTSQKKRITLIVLPLAAVFVLVAIFAYWRLGLFKSQPVRRFPIPVYETHVSHGTEATVKELDKRICTALMALKVPAEDVLFNFVETKTDNDDHWTYSDIEIRLQEPLPEQRIEDLFSQQLSEIIPKQAVRFSLGLDRDLVVEISVNGHLTHRLVFVVFEKKEIALSPPPQGLPLVAIIIDDMGYDTEMAANFLELDGILSFSVLPYSPYHKRIASAVHNSGRDVLLHLPMEPLQYPKVNPGEGALVTSMSPDELLEQLRNNLDAVPYIVGVNNHMGSRLTQDSAKMRQIFTILKRRGLFFVDSLTSPKSCCAQTAKIFNLKFARRQVFLDHIQEADAIRFQIKRLVTVAKRRGQAIGIGHPYPVTLQILKEELPNIKQQIKLVRISELVG